MQVEFYKFKIAISSLGRKLNETLNNSKQPKKKKKELKSRRFYSKWRHVGLIHGIIEEVKCLSRPQFTGIPF